MATRDELIALVRERYPGFAYLLGIPEVAKLLLDAVNPQIGYSPDEFTAKLQATNWWRTTETSRRQWDAFRNLDPATATDRIRERIAQLEDQTRQLGITVTHTPLSRLALQTLRDGIDLGSATWRNLLATYIPGAPTGAGASVTGTFRDVYEQIKTLARTEFMLPIADNDAWQMARAVVAGDKTLEGIRASFLVQSRSQYAGLTDVFDNGGTPGSYFAPIRQAIAEQLEVGADSIDLLDARWSEVLGTSPDGGTARPMTVSEAQRLARSTPDWRSTQGARRQVADMTLFLAEAFGQR